MSGYYIVGVAYVERYAPEEGQEVGEVEVFDTQAVGSIPNCDADMDFECSVYQDADVPKEPGAYALSYAAHLYFSKDYWGEVDCDATIEWFKVEPLSESHVADILGTEPPHEESFEDLLGDSISDITRIDNGKGN